MTQNNGTTSDAFQKLKPHFLKIEITLATIASMGLILKIYKINAGNLILLSALGLMALFYVLTGQMPLEEDEAESEDKAYGLFVKKLAGMTYAIIVVGILFSLMHWPQPKTHFYGGMVGLGIVLAVSAFRQQIFQPLPRIVIFAALSISFSLMHEVEKPEKTSPKVSELANERN